MSTAGRRGLATLADAAVLAAWCVYAVRRGAPGWDWLAFGVPLALVLWFDVRPYRTATARVALTRMAQWLLVFRFVALAFTLAFAHFVHPLTWALGAVALLFVVGAVLRVVEERAPLRVITAAPGGGFLVSYPPDAAVDAELASVPGGERDAGGWKFAATPETADALLRFARAHGFEFTP